MRSSSRIGAMPARSGRFSAKSVSELASEPKASAKRNRPMPQASCVPPTSRRVRPPGASSGADAAARPARAGRSPAPRSRRRRRIPAITSSTTTAARETSSGHQRRSTKARICCAQASGENQDSHEPSRSITSPMPRTMKESARIPSAVPEAVPACSVSWAVTAVTAPKTSPVRAVASPSASESAVPPPPISIPEATAAPRARFASATTSRAETDGARRPVGRERSSSSRPDSSSPRVRRAVSRIDMIAAGTSR